MRIRTGVIVALTLSPTLAVAASAWAARPRPRDRTAQGKLIQAIPRDPVALVNVSVADMPASPDILFLGKRSTRALERCLADNADATMRALCASMLGTLGDRSALPALQAALGDWEADVRLEVIRALGKMPADQSIDPLLALFNREDEEVSVRRAVLQALGGIGHPKAVAFLRHELAKSRAELARPGGDLRRNALQALWRCRHRFAPSLMVDEVLRALAPPRGHDLKVEALLWQNDADLVREGIGMAAQLRSGRFLEPLVALIASRDDKTQNHAVQALGLLGDARGVAPLEKLLPTARNARLLNNIAFALQRLDERAFTREIQRMVTHKQGVLRMNAAFVLGDIRHPKALKLLERSLVDPSESVQLEAVRAIAKLAPRPEALPLLERAISSQNESVRIAAIDAVAAHGNEGSIPVLEKLLGTGTATALDETIMHAIYRLSGGKRSDLVYQRLFRDPKVDEGVRRRAAILLGQARDSRVRDYLLNCFEANQCRLFEVAGFLRAETDPVVVGHVQWMWLRGQDELVDLVGVMHPPEASTLAGSGFDVAVTRGDWPKARQLGTLLGDLHAESARARLQAAANSTDGWFRISTLVTLCRLGDQDAAAALLRELDEFPIAWLPDLVDALHGLREPTARARVAAELERRQIGREPSTAVAAAAVRLPWTPDAALPRLLTALTSTDVIERETAERYLRRDRTPRVAVLLADRWSKERDPDLKLRLARLIDGRGED
jgi:HEAT repeat protein